MSVEELKKEIDQLRETVNKLAVAEESTKKKSVRKKSTKPRKPNPWFIHLKAFREKHPKLSMKEAMQGARKTYKKK